MLQRSTRLLAAQRAFKECTENILADLKEETDQLPNRIAANIVYGLQWAFEDFLTHLF